MTKQAICEQLQEAESILHVVREALLKLRQNKFENRTSLSCCTMAINATEEARTWLCGSGG